MSLFKGKITLVTFVTDAEIVSGYRTDHSGITLKLLEN